MNGDTVADERKGATDDARTQRDEVDEAALRGLAEEAGITTVWQDYRGTVHTVGASTLRALLNALELPSRTDDDIATSRLRLAAERDGYGELLPPLITAVVHAPIALPFGARFAGHDYRIVFDDVDGDGGVREGRFADDGPSIVEPIERFGYHRLEADGASLVLAAGVVALSATV